MKLFDVAVTGSVYFQGRIEADTTEEAVLQAQTHALNGAGDVEWGTPEIKEVVDRESEE